MTGKEIAEYRRKLREIRKTPERGAGSREALLKGLAEEVGASTYNHQGAFNASDPELIDNINDALRTESMINACQTASRNYVIAIIAAAASALSAAAAWAAVLFGNLRL